MIPVKYLALALWLIPLQAGCGPSRGDQTSDFQSFLRLKRGMTLRDVQRQLGVSGAPQFLAQIGPNQLTALEFDYYREQDEVQEIASFVYFLENNVLSHVGPLLDPSTDNRIRMQLDTDTSAECWIINGLKAAWNEKSLDHEGMAAAINQFEIQHHHDGPLVVLFLIIWPFLAAEQISDRVAEARHNPFNITLGMYPAQVRGRFGNPTHVQELCERHHLQIHVYGESRHRVGVVFGEHGAMVILSDRYLSEIKRSMGSLWLAMPDRH